MHNFKKFRDAPLRIVNWVNYVRRPINDFYEVAIDNADIDLEQVVLDFDQDAELVLQDFASEIVKRQDILEKDNLEPLLSRSREKAMRLSLSVTLAENPKAKRFLDIMKWCVDFVRYYDLLFIEACRDRVASSE